MSVVCIMMFFMLILFGSISLTKNYMVVCVFIIICVLELLWNDLIIQHLAILLADVGKLVVDIMLQITIGCYNYTYYCQALSHQQSSSRWSFQVPESCRRPTVPDAHPSRARLRGPAGVLLHARSPRASFRIDQAHPTLRERYFVHRSPPQLWASRLPHCVLRRGLGGLSRLQVLYIWLLRLPRRQPGLLVLHKAGHSGYPKNSGS
jgi:hypothetical protein